ncbi:MAG: hypothetical protein Q9192_005329 [Flavoplaca navasiana]
MRNRSEVWTCFFDVTFSFPTTISPSAPGNPQADRMTASATKSTHLTDPLLLPFLGPSFSATTYLNTTLPSRPSKPPQSTHLQQSTPLQPTLSTLTSQTQSHISTLSAQTTRLSATLTALTDDILRCSSRLTYEIEVLRGEANGLSEALGERGVLDPVIRTFLPEGLAPHSLSGGENKHVDREGNAADEGEAEDGTDKTTTKPWHQKQFAASAQSTDPSTNPPIPALRTLLRVRASLVSITKTFSLALSWPMPPSLLPSTTSSIISISSPSSSSTTASLEAEGQAALSSLRSEIEGMLLESDGEGGTGGAEKARARVKELRECVEVWKGTSEEKARAKWVEGVEAWVEEYMAKSMAARQGKESVNGRDGAGGRGIGEELVGGGSGGEGGRGRVYGAEATPARTGSGAGFLRRLRDEIYMD